jgi:hypothetical protein
VSEANGFALSVRQSPDGGCIQFMVVSDHGGRAGPPRVLACGDERSALRAMAAAEQAAAAMARCGPDMWEIGTEATGTLWPPWKANAPHPLASAARTSVGALDDRSCSSNSAAAVALARPAWSGLARDRRSTTLPPTVRPFSEPRRA